MSKEQPIFGIDVHPEYQRGLNFERARAEGHEFCVIKATEGPYRDGDSYVPSGFKEYFRRAEAEGFVMGVYAFLLSTPAEAQADHFLRTIESVGGPEDKILMVDFERYNPPHAYLTPENDSLHKFISALKREVRDHPIVLYSGRGFWNGGDSSGDFAQYGADVAWDAMYLDMTPHARPRDYYASVREEGWGVPWGGVEPWFWQFSSAGGVAGMNIDVNAYRGTREQLLALAGARGVGGTGGEDTEDEGARGVEVRGSGGGRRRMLAHGVVDGTNFARGFKYAMQLNNHMKYWVWSSGPVPDGEGAYAVAKPLPPADQLKGKRIFCLTGDTEVLAKDVERSYKRFYSGEVITVQTARGHKLTGTPNHPVLTEKGWLPLKLLRKGMDVVSSTSFGKAARLKPDDDESPASLEQIHRSVALSGDVERVVGTLFDFHGDGREGEIELVMAEGGLLGGNNSPLFEQSIKFCFPYTAIAGSGEPFPSAALRSRLMGRANHVQSLGFGKLAVLETLGFGVGAQYSGISESPFDNLPGDPVRGSNLSAGRSTEILADDGFGIDLDVIGGVSSGRSVVPMELGALLDTSESHAGIAEPSVDTPGRAAESLGDLVGAFAAEVGIDDVLGGDVVSSEGFGPDAVNSHLFALRSEGSVSLDEASADGLPAYAKPPSNATEGLSGSVCLDEVVSVEVGVFEGHVYNLQTASGTYVANGIISHNCAGVPNLFRRAAGKSIPTRGNPNYDGGIAAYFYTSAFGGLGPGFFSGVDVPFNLATAKKWARETGSGVLVGRCYRGSTLAGQGHVAILLPDGKVMQSFQFGADGEPGLNTDHTIEQSHAGGYYELMAHPKAWINHDKGQVWVPKPERIESPGDEVELVQHGPGGDEHPDGPEPQVISGPSGDLTDSELEDIGREVLRLIRRYAGQTTASHRRSHGRNEKEED